MKRLGFAAAALAALVALAALARVTAPWWTPAPQGPPPSGRLELESEEPIAVTRDVLGVPHVQAQSERDALRGLGFAHAQDRLFQMDLLRRAARGRLSEWFGARTLPEDRLARTLGFGAQATRERAGVRPSTDALLVAYADGANAWIREIREGRAERPFEYHWLDLDPEPWTPEDTLAIVRWRAWLMGRSLDTSLLLDRLVREVGGVASQEFFPTPDLPGREGLAERLLPLARLAERHAALAGLRGPVGSLGFVVGARHSASGLPLLVNDPHVELRLPALFHVAHLRTPRFEVAGAAWPGVPVFWTGTNGAIAWGQVALHASVSDLYEETLDPDDATRYDRSGRWLATDVRVEQIAVRGADGEALEVRATRHGPLLAAVLPGAAAGLALAWTGSSDDSGLEALLALEHAGTFEAFRDALRGVVAPAATFLYADREGNIGTQVAGSVPIRTIDTGLLPVPGRSGFYDWRGVVPFDELPSDFGAEVPWLVASTRPSPARFPVPIAWLWSESGSEGRVRRALASTARIDIEGALALEHERHAEAARREARALVGSVELPEGPASRLAEILLQWDGSTASDSAGAAVYHVFRHLLGERLLAERLEPALARAVSTTDEPLPGALLAGFLERVDRKDAERYVVETLEATWSWLGLHVSSNPTKWTWGRIHSLVLRHDFERLGDPWLAWVGRSRRLGPFPLGGSPDSIFAVHAQTPPPFEPGVGPAFSFAVDMSSPDHPRIGLAGGESGNPGSPHWSDALADWLDGRARPLWLEWADVTYHAVGTWELEPIRR